MGSAEDECLVIPEAGGFIGRSVTRRSSPAGAEPINRAQDELEAARFERQRVPTAQALWLAEVEAMLGDIGAALQRADPAKLEQLYRSLGLKMIYRSAERLVELRSHVTSERIRGGTCALTTPLAVG